MKPGSIDEEQAGRDREKRKIGGMRAFSNLSTVALVSSDRSSSSAMARAALREYGISLEPSEFAAFAAFGACAVARVIADVRKGINQEVPRKATTPGRKRLLVSMVLALPYMIVAIVSAIYGILPGARLHLPGHLPAPPDAGLQVKETEWEPLAGLGESQTDEELSRKAEPESGTLAIAPVVDKEAEGVVIGSGRWAWTRLRNATDSEAWMSARNLVARAVAAGPEEEGNVPGEEGRLTVRIALVNGADRDGRFHAYSWGDGKDFASQSISPMLAKLRNAVPQSRVETLVKHGMPAKGPPKWDAGRSATIQSLMQLPVNLEWFWREGPKSEVILIAYVPPPGHCPLKLSGSEGRISPTNAATVPGVGGIAIVNPDSCNATSSEPKQLPSHELARLTSIFTSHVRAAFGLPETPCGGFSAQMTCLPSLSDGVTEWEAEWITKRLERRAALAASQSLSSFRELSRSPMKYGIRLTEKATELAHLAAGDLISASEGKRDERGALQRANARARGALFDPDIVVEGNLSVEQILALFLPMAFPTLYPPLVKAAKEALRRRKRLRSCERD